MRNSFDDRYASHGWIWLMHLGPFHMLWFNLLLPGFMFRIVSESYYIVTTKAFSHLSKDVDGPPIGFGSR